MANSHNYLHITHEKGVPKELKKCAKCQFVSTSCSTDVEGNITISWSCSKRSISLFYKIIRSDAFLERYYWCPKEEVSVRENLDKCEEYKPKSHSLNEYPKRG